MDTQKLRQHILDLAIRGKLVPQDPTDEPASVLLDRIRAEKERLIAEGKIKRPKAKKSTDKSQYQQFTPPFDIPASWEWVRLGDIIEEPKYGTSSKSLSKGRIPVLRMGNITKDGEVEYSNLVYSDNESEIIEYQLKKGDILFNRTNSSEWVGKSALYDGELEAIYAGYLVRVRPIMILSEYLILVMTSSYYRNWCHLVKTDAVNQSNINAQKLKSFLLPLPPLKEQRRIYDNFLKLSVLVRNISDSCNKLSDMISLTKSKILDLAMQGKLVPQDPADEPAADMLRRINPKARIITDNPHSWNIPNGWVLAYLKEVVFSPSSKQFQILQSEIKHNGHIPVISQSSNFIEGYSENENKAFRPNNGIVIFGDHTKNVKFFSENFIIGADGVKLIDWNFDKQFLYYLITYVSKKIPNKGYSRHFQYLLAYVIGLPPLNEQKRIVAKVEELYSVLDEIEASLQS